ncbi:Gibberellin 2-beta-dioxygenase 8 [Heracleum sosnowskyi]|uniref:Gibberellin 2-beta-dioxygenase 8 n=1 Tax=Heracleum sosnowskyi TaxID=360622 RepID=A0AAD8ITH4_9APIA|nr:Gibberellin 2-beta-dioxygenase 8 [Heracleum sosnowskyi]
MDCEPPLAQVFLNLPATNIETDEQPIDVSGLKCYELPLVDLGRLNSGHTMNRKECEKEIIEAAKEWGFFQVVNHGICKEMLVKLQEEQVKLFQQPFHKKANQSRSNSPTGFYRWGNLAATSRAHFSWSEAFHIPVSSVSDFRTLNHSSSTVEEYIEVVSELIQIIAEILADNMGICFHKTFLAEKVVPSSCYLRMNRYPPCPNSYSKARGLVSHTDTSYLTVLQQDNIGGLQLMKDGAWICVKPNPNALVINIGDLFEAWSNGLYKSVRHRVVTNGQVERFSVAYFYCPTTETVVRSCSQPSIYRDFTFEEFKRQIQFDVRSTGNKIGLPRFLR